MKRKRYIKLFIPVLVVLPLMFILLATTGLAEQDNQGHVNSTIQENNGGGQSVEVPKSPNIPPIAYSPAGTVKDQGENVPDGTTITASCGVGEVYSKSTTTVNVSPVEGYPIESWYGLSINGDDTLEDGRQGCLINEPIEFKIGDQIAYQSVLFSSGSELLELTTDEPIPAIDLEKLTNGEDADTPPGPALVVVSAVTWTLALTNTGNVTLETVKIVDDAGTPGDANDDQIACEFLRLSPSDPQLCWITGTVTSGQFSNIAVSDGSFNGSVYSDTDSSHYLGVQPALTLEKLTNGLDADAEPGPQIVVGEPITWTYLVTNTGDVVLELIRISDDNGTPGNAADDVDVCDVGPLVVGASDYCEWTGNVAAEGQYGNIGTAWIMFDGILISATDPSHYFGKTEKQYLYLPMIVKN